MFQMMAGIGFSEVLFRSALAETVDSGGANWTWTYPKSYSGLTWKARLAATVGSPSVPPSPVDLVDLVDLELFIPREFPESSSRWAPPTS
jgi:hypothetical protein